jgi:cullin 1
MINFEFVRKLKLSISKYTAFYNDEYQGRKLTWLYNLSKGELVTNCYKKKYIFIVSIALKTELNSNIFIAFHQSIDYH